MLKKWSTSLSFCKEAPCLPIQPILGNYPSRSAWPRESDWWKAVTCSEGSPVRLQIKTGREQWLVGNKPSESTGNLGSHKEPSFQPCLWRGNFRTHELGYMAAPRGPREMWWAWGVASQALLVTSCATSGKSFTAPHVHYPCMHCDQRGLSGAQMDSCHHHAWERNQVLILRPLSISTYSLWSLWMLRTNGAWKGRSTDTGQWWLLGKLWGEKHPET